MNFAVKNWRAGKGQIKCYFTLVYGDLEVNDCRLVAGQHGDFVAYPQRKWVDKEGQDKYTSVVFVPDKDRKQKLNDWAVGELAKLVQPVEPEKPDDIPF